jgi:hypothetical protein
MPYTKTDWKDRIVQKPQTYTMVTNPDGTVTLTPAPGTVTQEGTPLNAANLNKIEDGVAKALTAAGENVHLARSNTITIAAGATSDFVVNFPVGLFTTSPNVDYSLVNGDIDGLYTTARGINTNGKEGVTIRIKNRGSTTQYYIVYVTAIGK